MHSQNHFGRKQAVLVASTSPLRRYGLAQLCRTYAGPSSDVEVVEADSFDAVLIEMQRPVLTAIVSEFGHEAIANADAFRRLRAMRPSIKLVAVSPSREQHEIAAALSAGAHGYVIEQETTTQLAVAIRSVQGGNIYLPPSIAIDTNIAVALHPLENSTGLKLTPRQIELLPLIAQGLSNKQIAQRLEISVSTAKFHVGTLLRSLNSSNRTQAAGKATVLLGKNFGG